MKSELESSRKGGLVNRNPAFAGNPEKGVVAQVLKFCLKSQVLSIVVWLDFVK